jgi:heat shock protein HtpX
VAHELSHIANRDVVVMTVASFLATVAGLLIRMSTFARVGRGGRDNAAAAFFVILLVSIVTYVVSYLLLRALSRYREYAADRGAAIMTGAPSQLATALLKISGQMERIPTRDLRAAEGLNAFFILPAVAKGFSLSSLFSTHPPVELRVQRLMDMQAAIDSGPVATE